jgi:hypothetical protein
MTTMTAEKALTKIQGEKIVTDKPQRFPEAASVGNYFRQGDLYISLLASVPDDAVKSKVDLQLADGNTQGSRHCLDSKAGVTMYRLASPGITDGPIIDLKHERVITHPEHGHCILPAGVYSITYQRDLDAEDRERRVLD